jgi:hypothetical protein
MLMLAGRPPDFADKRFARPWSGVGFLLGSLRSYDELDILRSQAISSVSTEGTLASGESPTIRFPLP